MDDRDNGILGTVPGAVIGAAGKQLPPPETFSGQELQVTVDADWLGAVTITYSRQRMKHGRSSHWAWVAVHAEKAAGGP